MRNGPNLLKLFRKYHTIIQKILCDLEDIAVIIFKNNSTFICRNLTKTEQHRKTSNNLKPNSRRNGPNLLKLPRKYHTIIQKLLCNLEDIAVIIFKNNSTFICLNLTKTEQHRKTSNNLKPNSMRNGPNLQKLPRKYCTIIQKLSCNLEDIAVIILKNNSTFICQILTKTEQYRKTSTNLKPNSMRNDPNLLKLPRKYRTIIQKLLCNLEDIAVIIYKIIPLLYVEI